MDPTSRQDDRPLYRYRFGNAEFDEARFELRVGGLTVDLEQRPLQVLACLLHRPDEVVSREELFETVWAGRPTVDNVLANAMAKLRKALGPEDAVRVLTLPRIGYRLLGPVERIASGRRLLSRMDLVAGQAVPGREHFVLEALLGPSRGNEVWLARHTKTGDLRVYKFSTDGERLAGLKREATIYRVLHESLGERADFVRVLDWNFETAPFYLECEYGGTNLADWAVAEPGLAALDSGRRVALFLQIADAVAAAHGVGVLHKDLKPANVLIEADGDGWQLRIGDFGSGRLLEPGRLEELGITSMGLTLTQAVSADTSGTLLYLAPEVLAGQPPSVRSDVYALGLMLYQLLAGDLRRPLSPGWEQDIADPLLREDIAAATDGNPARRLASVAELAARLRNLEQRRDERASAERARERAAAAERALERARALRPWRFGAITLLGAGLAVALLLYLRAERALADARREQARAAAVTQFLDEDVLGAADPYVDGSAHGMTVSEALEQAQRHVDGRFTQYPVTEATVRMTLATLLHRLQNLPAAEAQWRKAIAILDTSVGPQAVDTLQARYQLVSTLVMASRFDEAATLLHRADRDAAAVLPKDAGTAALAERAWGIYYLDQQQGKRAIPHLEHALYLEQRMPQPSRYLLNGIRIDLMSAYTGSDRFADAATLGAAFLAELKSQPGLNDLTLASVEHLYGEALLYQDHADRAAPLIDDAVRITGLRLPPGAPLAVAVLSTQCDLKYRQQHQDEALACILKLHQAMLLGQGKDHWMSWATLENAGIIEYDLGRDADSVQALRTAHTELGRTVGLNNTLTLSAAYYLARSLLKRGELSEAAALVASLTPEQLAEAEPGAPWKQRLDLLRGLILVRQGHVAEGRLLLRSAVDNMRREHPDDSGSLVEQALQVQP